MSRSRSDNPAAGGPQLPVPERIGRYQVIDRLAAGGMAEVFICAEHQMAGLERLVVVKRILPHLAIHQPFVDMFLAEARYVARINHPNVVQIHELGEDNGAPFLSMEYVAGVSLRDLLVAAIEHDKPLPVGVAVSLAAQACAGAHAAHELKDGQGKLLGLVHRDISPHNLMVTADGHVKLLDFGIAKATEAPGFNDNTRTGALKGKVHYMAPEQCKQEPLDRRADVFALGIVAWELLARERLFKRDSELDAMQAIVNGDLRDLRAIRKDVPTVVVAAVEKALAPRREARFQSADAFKKALLDAAGPSVDTSPEAVAAFVRPLFGASLEARRDEFQRAAHERTQATRTSTGTGSGSRSLSLSDESESTVVDKPTGSHARPQLPAVGESVIDSDPFGDLADMPTVRNDRQGLVTTQQEGARRGAPAAAAGTGAAAVVDEPNTARTAVAADSAAIERRAPSRARTVALAVAVAAVTCAVVTTALLLLPKLRGPQVAGAPLVIAWPPTVEPARLALELPTLARVLEAHTKRPVVLELATSYDDVVARMQSGRASFGVLPPALFVLTRRAHPDIVPIATKLVDGSAGSDGVLLVREDSEATDLAGLRGKTFCFPNEKSTTGWILPRARLREAGIDPDRDIQSHISGDHTKVLKDLTAGVCDAGATYSGGYLAADRAGIPVGRARVLMVTGRSPQDMLVAWGTTTPADREVLQRALLAIDPKKDVGADTIGTLERISGFVAPRLGDFAAIEKAIPPSGVVGGSTDAGTTLPAANAGDGDARAP